MPRGIPINALPCQRCPSQNAGADGLCFRCRALQTNPKMQGQYRWTPELDEMVRKAWAVKKRSELCKRITAIAKQSGFPRGIIVLRAQQFGLAFTRRKRWTPEEMQKLRNLAGEKSVRQIAHILKRGRVAIAQKLTDLRLSRRLMEGYTQDDLRELFGVSQRTIDRWLARKWMRVNPDGRIGDYAVGCFIREHPEECDLRRVDEPWFKGMIFPSFGLQPVSDGESINPYEARP